MFYGYTDLLRMGVIRSWKRTIRLCAGAGLLAAAAFALSPALSLRQYQHISWTEFDGRPLENVRIVQQADGYLVVSTREGLLRFDGVRFTPALAAGQKVSDKQVRGLAASRDGGVWLDTDDGLAQ